MSKASEQASYIAMLETQIDKLNDDIGEAYLKPLDLPIDCNSSFRFEVTNEVPNE